MEREQKWMIMTYYCPTHGNSGIVEPVEITKKEIVDSYLVKERKPREI